MSSLSSSGTCSGLFSLSQVNLCDASSLLLENLLLSVSELKTFRYAVETLTPRLQPALPPHFLFSPTLGTVSPPCRLGPQAALEVMSGRVVIDTATWQESGFLFNALSFFFFVWK